MGKDCITSRTPADITTEAMMTRAATEAAIVLVEASEDSRFFRRHLIGDSTERIICEGKATVLASVPQIRSKGIDRFIAIVDRDFDIHRGVKHDDEVFLTDEHDLETTLLACRLNSLLAEFGDKGKITSFIATNSQTIEEALLERASNFAKLRFLNEVNPRFAVSMNSITPWRYIETKSWTLDASAMVNTFCSLVNESESQISTRLAALANISTWKDVRGHDVLKILSIGLERTLGFGKGVSEAQLLSGLRMLYSEHDFRSSNLYQYLVDWQAKVRVSIVA